MHAPMHVCMWVYMEVYMDVHMPLFFCFFGGSNHDKLLKLAHHKALAKALGIKDRSCPALRLSHKTV